MVSNNGIMNVCAYALESSVLDGLSLFLWFWPNNETMRCAGLRSLEYSQQMCLSIVLLWQCMQLHVGNCNATLNFESEHRGAACYLAGQTLRIKLRGFLNALEWLCVKQFRLANFCGCNPAFFLKNLILWIVWLCNVCTCFWSVKVWMNYTVVRSQYTSWMLCL